LQSDIFQGPRARRLLQIAVLATLYVVSGWLGLELAFFQENATLIWPPTGFSLAALILVGPRLWPGVLIGAFTLNTINGSAPVPAFTIAVGNTLEAVVGAFVMVRGFDFRPTLERVRDVLALVIVGGVFASAISATIGVASVWWSGGVRAADIETVWLIWWRGDLGGAVIVTPLALLLRSGTPEWAILLRHREFWIVSAVLLASSLLAFRGVAAPAWEPDMLQVAFGCMIWAGVRLGPRGALLISSSAIAIGAIQTARGLGPFVGVDPHASIGLLWTYAMQIGTVALILAAAVNQRDVAERQRREEQDERQRIERKQLLSQERERIMREMHDGIGGQLVSVLSMVQRGQASDEDVAEALRRTLDDMRLMIDSMEGSNADLSELLGRLRARLTPMLRRNGLGLRWDVDEVPALAALEPEQSLHCLRIVQEAIANVVQHAQASNVGVRVSSPDADPDAIAIEIQDDGIGFAAHPIHQGRGVRNMRARAEALGAELRIEQTHPGRRIRLLVSTQGVAALGRGSRDRF